MPRYIPIDTGHSMAALSSDLVGFAWAPPAAGGFRDGITADFLYDDEQNLRVSFRGACIVRILDEFPLSTEDDGGPSEGLVPNNFAYRVEGSKFFEAQSEAWKLVLTSVSHYRFITGNGCMDVLSANQPSFSLVPAVKAV